MGRGPQHHLKRLAAPKHWMLRKMSGVFAPKPQAGPHAERECLPLVLLLRNKLKYALTAREAKTILQNRLVKVDGKVRRNHKYPAGFMDVVRIDKTNESFRLLYDTKGRYIVHRVTAKEANFKLGKVKRLGIAKKGIRYLVTHDGRTIRYPHPDIRPMDTVKIDIKTGKISQFVKYEVGTLIMMIGGKNRGRVGRVQNIEKHIGTSDTVYIKDARGRQWATRPKNLFVIGVSTTSWISLPTGKGIKLTPVERRDQMLKNRPNLG
mmetsp:Transcript_15371/g.17109  ORF Transcript_15371/g.17109 Transcript_15371/m.17109 type:complete len:264 (+) Transcript_15371:55-846(+)|eukprot:CAMPEP_0168519104 /NCGR_PEP_ID=MMETSP0405-20121227/7122_1 /TAXON_ID=498012 /ORGANISM="Trichosphaerium sp, Strain Am-I-7 wt" /LENGTH=263 /DNA_ID=CAMNT_0008539589 /DNA_START=40 /DNA_END=831 /DNA_ORIENTATION=+